MHFTITSEHAKMRLDKFLKEQFPQLSRAQLQKLIEASGVTVDGKRVPVHYFLRAGDKVETKVEKPEELRVVGNKEVRLEIIHEEPDFIVLNKPAGLVVHQSEKHKVPDTLVNGLLARYPEIAKVGEDLLRPGIVHRLDADVSGAMVVARTADMFDHLKRQFKLHEIKKEYVALVQGKVSPPEGVIELPIGRKGGRMVARGKGQAGKLALTEYAVIGKDKNTTTLKIKTYTGRTHQIRVHLKGKGWPIIGDILYGGRVHERLLLHAKRLAFKDLKNNRQEFISEPPFL